jgi:hypothetical protein
MDKMRFLSVFLLISLLTSEGFSQNLSGDTVITSEHAVVRKDKRVDLFGKKMAEYNESLALKIQLVDGYRLMLLNTTDRNLAMKVRSTLIQKFPEQKLYMTFLSPYIKIKVGNFLDRDEAEKVSKQIAAMNLIPGNIYLLNEKVEQKPVDKTVVPADE